MPDRFIELVALPPRVVSACCETYLKHVFLDIWCAQAIGGLDLNDNPYLS